MSYVTVLRVFLRVDQALGTLVIFYPSAYKVLSGGKHMIIRVAYKQVGKLRSK